jgi:hypothetical protein
MPKSRVVGVQVLASCAVSIWTLSPTFMQGFMGTNEQRISSRMAT